MLPNLISIFSSESGVTFFILDSNLVFFFISLNLIHSKKVTERQRERDLSFAGSFPRWTQQLELNHVSPKPETSSVSPRWTART